MRLKYAAPVMAAFVVLLASCSVFWGPRDIRLPLAKLQQQLEASFPSNERYLALFDVNLREPRLRLLPELNRVEVSLATTIVPLLTNQPLNGSLAISGTLRVDTARHLLLLAQPRIEKFVLDGADDATTGRVAGFLAQQFLSELPLYSFGEQGFRYAGANFMPTRIVTEENALVVTFEPVK